MRKKKNNNDYAVIKLKNGDDYFPAICKKIYTIDSFLENINEVFELVYNWDPMPVWKDLVTGKNIYYKSDEDSFLSGVGLNYEFSTGYADTYQNLVEYISAERALQLIKGLSPEQLDNYRLIMNDLESDAIRAHKDKLEQHKKVEVELEKISKRR